MKSCSRDQITRTNLEQDSDCHAQATIFDEADEEDFLQLVVANDTVLNWIDKWKLYEESSETSCERLAVLVHEISQQVSSKEPYAEEARECGLSERALITLKRLQGSDDTTMKMMDDLSMIIAACSGPLAQGDRVKTITYGGHDVVVKEGALGDGVGAKLWRVARIMCHRMAEDYSNMILEKDVLEVGAGVGACGFLAAKLGAKNVFITDYVDKLLLNLKDALALNITPGSCSHPDDGWTSDNVNVRFLDWEDSVIFLNKNKDSSKVIPPPPAALDGECSRNVAPGVPENLQFDTIIGTDVLYEWPMVQSLSAAIKHRLKKGGTAYICNAVRDQEMFDALVECIEGRDLLVQVDHIDNHVLEEQQDNDSSTFCRDQDYEGGYVWVVIKHPE